MHLGFSRDGFHITRPPPPRRPFVRPPRQTLDLRAFASHGHGAMGVSNVQLASGSPIVAGDRLLFYFGYGAAEGFSQHDRGSQESIYSRYVEATGVATLRRDGFAGLLPPAGARAGVLTTRPLVYNGSRLFANVLLQPGGSLSVALLPPDDDHDDRDDRDGATRPAALCGLDAGDDAGDDAPLRIAGPRDATRVQVGEASALVGAYSGRRVRLRFTVEAGELFAFWITHDRDGKSRGYLGGGAFGAPRIVDD